MMTLEEAIKHCKDVALSCTNKECALEHLQLLKWLQEYSNMLEKQGEQKPQRMISAEAKEALYDKPVGKAEPFDKYEGFTDFERTLADICIGWIGEEPGWEQYIKDNSDVLLRIATEKFNSVQDAPSEQKPAWSEEDEKMMNSFLHKVEVCNLLTNKENVWFINKLKSLKQRIAP